MSKLAESRFASIEASLTTPPQCRLCRWLTAPDTPSEDAAFIVRLLRDPGKSSPHIAAVLTRGGVALTESSVKRHRQKHLGQ